MIYGNESDSQDDGGGVFGDGAGVAVQKRVCERGSFCDAAGLLPHAQLILGAGRELADALEDGPCNVTVTELRLQVAAQETYVYPDVMVVCGAPEFVEGLRDMIANPSVVVEVLPESTEAWDRGGKFAQYRRVASLREYVPVSEDAMRVEWFTREEDGRWSYREAVGPDGVVRLDELGVTLALGRIYRQGSWGNGTGRGPY